MIITKFDEDADIYIFTEPEEGLAWIRKYGHSTELGQLTLFLDINMPTMTGWDFLDEFIKFSDWVKSQFYIYILSSSIEDCSDKAIKYPFVSGFLSKPLKIPHLEEIILQENKSA